jgi:zinc protease
MFTAAMLEFGTAQHDADTIGKMLDEVGAELEFEAAGGFLYWTGRCLADDLPRLLAILSAQLRNPVFPAEEFESVRKQLISEARLESDDAGSLAGLAYNRAVHPPEHPARLPDEDETIRVLKSLNRQDLIDFHREWFGPASAIVVVTGDVDPANCRTEVDKAFGGWSGGKPAPWLSPIPLPGSGNPRMLSIPLAGKESSRVLIGQPCALDQTAPDALALSLATAALGNGFTSRLVSTVRDAEGLTYAVDSYLAFPPSGDPTWQIAATFAPDLLEQGVASIRRELDRWLRDGLDESEFAYRRGAMIGAHRIGLATSEGRAEALHDTARRGLPLSWLDDQETRLLALSRDDVNRAIRQYLDPGRMVEVRCGDLPPPHPGTPRR